MHKLLYEYNLDLTTWVYLSSLLILTVYFKFSPLLRVRNLDMIGVVAYAPGLVMMQTIGLQQAGYIWVLCLNALLVVRLLLDPLMVRRPLLEPNLNTSGQIFLGSAVLLFLAMHTLTRTVDADYPWPSLPNEAEARLGDPRARLLVPPVGNRLIQWFESRAALPPRDVNQPPRRSTGPSELPVNLLLGRILALIAQGSIVGAFIALASIHFQNASTGVAMAGLYLMLPTTALYVDRLDQAITAALLLWAITAYPLPFVAGGLIGSAAAATYYPLFLLPLWLGFYWQRGGTRFTAGFLLAFTLQTALCGALFGWETCFRDIQYTFGWGSLDVSFGLGLWGPVFNPLFRLPMMIAFAALILSFGLWPVDKNLGALSSATAAAMVAVQFWHPHGGGAYFGWYLPLALVTVFRPNLSARTSSMIYDLRPAPAAVNGGVAPNAKGVGKA